ncbi:MAG TPA: hypothetical protein VGL65_00500 [Gemmatimonadales bacterium]
MPVRLIVLSGAMMVFVGVAARAQNPQPGAAPPNPCRADSNARRFDFWVGEWKVTASNTAVVVGHSQIVIVSGGCALLENWTAANGADGKSLNTYNPSLRHWEQFWVGSGGAVTEYRDSEWRDDTLVYLAHSISPSGPYLQRLSFAPVDSNTVRQLGETSTDGGQSWTIGYDLYYHRVP